jgi:hypothetical protein
MAKYKLVADVSSWQPSDVGYMNTLKTNGIEALMVKLTDGTGYLSPSAGKQVTNAFNAGIKTVGLYHFFEGDAVNEANYFLKWVKAFKMDTSTVLAIDVEARTIGGDITAKINTFLDILHSAGYYNLVTYGSASWFKSGMIDYSRLKYNNIWVASYGSSEPGIDHADAWQFTDNFKGLKTDVSYDFFGVLTGSSQQEVKHDTYLSDGDSFKVTTDYLYLYSDVDFTKKTKYCLAHGSIFHAKPVRDGSVYRLKLDDGHFVSANTKYVKKV